MMKLTRYLLLYVLILSFLGQSLIAIAHSSTVQVTQINTSHWLTANQLIFKITGAPFHYQWKLTEQGKQLTLTFYHVHLKASLPSRYLLNPLIKNVSMHETESALQLQFLLSTAVTIKTHLISKALNQDTALVIDFKPLSAKMVPIQLSVKTNKDINTQIPLQKQSNKPIMIIIDPGHGGKDSGAIGPGHTQEKEVVLAISKKLVQLLNKQPNFQAQLTRSTDIFIPLRQRLAITRHCKADLLIAIHADAAYNNQVAGASVFALSDKGATSEMARWLAQKENASELMYGIFAGRDKNIRSVLLDLFQTHTIAVSLKIGKTLLQQLSHVTRLHDPRVEQAAFVVLKSPDIPSLLIETGYITNPIQEQKLKNQTYQLQLATAIMQGIKLYFTQYPPAVKT